MLYAIESGIKVKVKEGADVNLKGVLKRPYNPNELVVPKDELYTLGLCKLYNGTTPIESILGINEEDYFTDDMTRVLSSLLKDGLIEGTPVEPNEPCYIEDLLGNNVEVSNSCILNLTDSNGNTINCSVVPSNYNVCSIEDELINNKTIVLGLSKKGIGSNTDHEDGHIHDIEVSYSVFKDCFEFVK